MTLEGGYKAEEAWTGMRFSCLCFFGSHFITETSKYEHRINTFIFYPMY